MTFTIKYINHALRSGHWRGQYETAELALEAAKKLAENTRAFMEYAVCEGTSKNPGADVPGMLVKGKC